MYRTTIDFCISIFYSVLFSLFSLTFPKYNPPGELLFQVTSIKSPRTNIPQDTFGKHKPNLYNYFVLSPVTHAAAIYAFRPLFILYPLHAASSPLVCLENSCVYFWSPLNLSCSFLDPNLLSAPSYHHRPPFHMLVYPCLFTDLSPSGALSALSTRLRAGSSVFMTCKGWLKGWQEVRGKHRAPVCSLSTLSLSHVYGFLSTDRPHARTSTNLKP